MRWTNANNDTINAETTGLGLAIGIETKYGSAEAQVNGATSDPAVIEGLLFPTQLRAGDQLFLPGSPFVIGDLVLYANEPGIDMTPEENSVAVKIAWKLDEAYRPAHGMTRYGQTNSDYEEIHFNVKLVEPGFSKHPAKGRIRVSNDHAEAVYNLELFPFAWVDPDIRGRRKAISIGRVQHLLMGAVKNHKIYFKIPIGPWFR